MMLDGFGGINDHGQFNLTFVLPEQRFERKHGEAIRIVHEPEIERRSNAKGASIERGERNLDRT